MKALTEEIIASQYIRAATNHGEGTHNGDYRLANKSYDQLKKIVTTFFVSDRALAARVLLPLFEDADLSVRLWAASDCLQLGVRAVEAEARIASIAEMEGVGLFSLSAKMFLRERSRGKLLDYESPSE